LRTQKFKQIKKKKKIDHENMKKQPSKVAHNSHPALFLFTGLAAQKAHFRQKWEFYRLSVSPLYNLFAK
jgi:hypothetical protein